MKKLTIVLLLLLACSLANAKPVDSATARRIAERMLGVTDLVDRSSELPFDEVYLFAPADSHGFVLVSADDCALPVLGYSATGVFSADVAPALAWIEASAGQIADMRRQGIEGSAIVVNRWRRLLGDDTPSPKDPVVGPLLTTTWNQVAVYQLYTPFDPNAHKKCLAGCGAIAMAQVMKYWNHPATGRGSHSYYTATYGFGPLDANFDTAYAWNDMPNAVTSASPQAQKDAVSLLVYHAGVSIEMDYTGNWSSSYIYYDEYDGPSVETALPTYFKYRSSARAVNMCEYSAAEWDSLLRVELDALRPVIYRGADPNAGGHIFVMDGVDADGAFHFNWGWGGSSDGFYPIGSLNPSGYNYNGGNSAVIGIEPLATEESSIHIEAVANNPAWGHVTGNTGDYPPYWGECNGHLTAVAAKGYRFDHWSDGSINNPRRFPFCESRSDTAVFVPAGGDTLGYCLPRYRWSYGKSNPSPTYGAVCLTPNMRPADLTSLAATQIYINEPGTYIVNIYCGDTLQPDSLLFTQSYVLTERGQWVTLQFDSLVSFPSDKPLWVGMQTNDITWSIPTSRYSGMDKSFLYSGDGQTWYDVHEQLGYMSAMIRAVFFNPNPVSVDRVWDDNIVVDVHERTVAVHSPVGGDIALYDLGGRLLCASRGNDMRYTAPAAGVYILRVASSAKKIIVF